MLERFDENKNSDTRLHHRIQAAGFYKKKKISIVSNAKKFILAIFFFDAATCLLSCQCSSM